MHYLLQQPSVQIAMVVASVASATPPSPASFALLINHPKAQEQPRGYRRDSVKMPTAATAPAATNPRAE